MPVHKPPRLIVLSDKLVWCSNILTNETVCYSLSSTGRKIILKLYLHASIRMCGTMWLGHCEYLNKVIARLLFITDFIQALVYQYVPFTMGSRVLKC